MSGGPQEVSEAFVRHFYQAFDGGVDQLAGLYVSFCTTRHAGKDCDFIFTRVLCRVEHALNSLTHFFYRIQPPCWLLKDSNSKEVKRLLENCDRLASASTSSSLWTCNLPRRRAQSLFLWPGALPLEILRIRSTFVKCFSWCPRALEPITSTTTFSD